MADDTATFPRSYPLSRLLDLVHDVAPTVDPSTIRLVVEVFDRLADEPERTVDVYGVSLTINDDRSGHVTLYVEMT